MRQPAGASLPVGLTCGLRFHPHGAGVHDPRPKRRSRRQSRDHGQGIRPEGGLWQAQAAAPGR